MTANNANNNSSEVIYPGLSFTIIGASFAVFNNLGWGLSELDYQRALEQELKKRDIEFKREVYIPLKYNSVKITRYFADFVVDSKILLELKVVSKLGYTHVKQVLHYLRCANLRLGILIYFTKDGVKYRRILNSRVKSD